MPKTITLTGLRLGADDAQGDPPCGQYMEPILIDGKHYCRSTETGKIYDPATNEEVVPKVPGSRLLNYGITMGIGALVGIMAVAARSKRPMMGTKIMVGAGVGAAVGALLLAVTWPRREAGSAAGA